jgi:hypothetical protein
MTLEILLIIAVWALLTKFALEPLLRRAIPQRFTVRYLLLATTVAAVYMAIIATLARR